jgi:ABC-type branched-subunit amino acid transport system substrate-binding protein
MVRLVYPLIRSSALRRHPLPGTLPIYFLKICKQIGKEYHQGASAHLLYQNGNEFPGAGEKYQRGLAVRSGRRHYQSLIAKLILLLILCGCASVDPVIKIGLVAPFEGAQRAIGYDVIYSARLAVREINQAGGIGGYRVALVALDDAGDPELARQTAGAMVADPAVVAVLGNWLPETTAVVAPIYAQAGLPFIPMGRSPFGPADPAELSAEFVRKYTAVTPFDEQPGPYAGSTYHAFQLLWQALEESEERHGILDRAAVADGLAALEYSSP